MVRFEPETTCMQSEVSAVPLNQLLVGKQHLKLLFILHLFTRQKIEYITIGVKYALY